MCVRLHAASAFSFLQGASLPEALVDVAAELGYRAVALLDRDGVYGAPRFHKAALSISGSRPIIGAELTIGTGGAGQAGRAGGRKGRRGKAASKIGPAYPALPAHPAFVLPVLCEEPRRLSQSVPPVTREDARAEGKGALTLEDLEGCTSGLVAIAGRAALDGRRQSVGGFVDRLVGIFGRDSVYVELQRHFRRDEERDTPTRSSTAAAFRVPTLATNGVRFARPRPNGRCRRAHLPAPPHRPRQRRGAAPRAERGAISGSRPPRWRRSSAIIPARSRAPASSRIGCILDGRPRLPVSDYPVPHGDRRRRSCGASPTSARASATGRTTTRPARRSRASWISSRSSSSPATSSSSGTS